jgi:hypothetical protein
LDALFIFAVIHLADRLMADFARLLSIPTAQRVSLPGAVTSPHLRSICQSCHFCALLPHRLFSLFGHHHDHATFIVALGPLCPYAMQDCDIESK